MRLCLKSIFNNFILRQFPRHNPCSQTFPCHSMYNNQQAAFTILWGLEPFNILPLNIPSDNEANYNLIQCVNPSSYLYQVVQVCPSIHHLFTLTLPHCNICSTCNSFCTTHSLLIPQYIITLLAISCLNIILQCIHTCKHFNLNTNLHSHRTSLSILSHNLYIHLLVNTIFLSILSITRTHWLIHLFSQHTALIPHYHLHCHVLPQ